MENEDINYEIVKRLGLNTSRLVNGKGLTSCPFHNDRHPSFSIDINQGIYHCFSCQDSGTLRGLYYKITGHGIMKDLGIEPTGESIFSIHKQPEVVSFDETPEAHVKWEGNLVPASASPDAIKYLNKRGIPIHVANEMNIKFAFSGYTKDAENPTDKKKWIYVKDRLITPVYENKKLLSLEMRDVLGEKHYKEELEKKGLDPDEIKYKKVLYPLRSSTNTLFQYGHLDMTKPLYFLEGLMDLGVLRADPYFKNSTSVFGASIGQRQQYLLKKFPELIYIADHDKAGLISIWRLKKQLGRSFKYVFAPKGCKDVGDIPQNLKISVKDCRERKWLATMKDSDNFDIVQEAINSEFVDAEDLEMIKSLVEKENNGK